MSSTTRSMPITLLANVNHLTSRLVPAAASVTTPSDAQTLWPSTIPPFPLTATTTFRGLVSKNRVLLDELCPEERQAQIVYDADNPISQQECLIPGWKSFSKEMCRGVSVVPQYAP